MKTIVLGHKVPSYLHDVVVTIQPEHLADFRHMVFRAMNTWQDAPAEMRKLQEALNPVGYIPGKVIVNNPNPLSINSVTHFICTTCGKASNWHPFPGCDIPTQ